MWWCGAAERARTTVRTTPRADSVWLLRVDALATEATRPRDSEKEQYAEVFEQMQGVVRERNVYVQPGAVETRAADAEHAPMTEEELRAEPEARERLLQRLQERDGVMTEQ